MVFDSLLLALGLFTITFYLSYQPMSLLFTPYLISVCVGFSLLSLGRSISQAPAEIIELLVLSVYNVMRIESRHLHARAASYSLLSGICVYLDLMYGAVILVSTITCCQWLAARLLKYCVPTAKRIVSLINNLLLLGMGAGFAISVRLIGYSYANSKSLVNTWFEWKNALTHRISGNIHSEDSGNIIDVARELVKFRGNPFYGIMSTHGTDVWNSLGMLGWILILPICLILYNKKAFPLDVLCGFLLAGILVPGWFITFEQHTIIHAGSTGRLVSLFAGLGMSAALIMIWILKESHTVDKELSYVQK